MVTRLLASRTHFISAPYVIAAIVVACIGGFGVGAALFGALLVDAPLGTWWLAATQAHGHAQIFGWAGLMVFGVALHFLPRLRGAPLVGVRFLPLSFALIVSGLTLRIILQPLVAASGESSGWFVEAVSVLLALSGLFELGGASLVIGVLVATIRRGGPLGERRGFAEVLPLIAVSFSTFWLALTLNAAALLGPGPAPGLLPSRLDTVVVYLGLVGFLVPISVAVSARTFPLYLWTPVPSRRWLWLGLVALLLGLALRVGGLWYPGEWISAMGSFLEGIALVGFITVLGVLHRRGTAPNPRRIPPASERASTMLIVPAYAWLGIAGILQIATSVATLASIPAPPPDLERHVLGAGFINMLILGMGLRLLPGFMKTRSAGATPSWWAVGLGHGAALTRTLPVFAIWLVPTLRGPALSVASALAGLLGIAAIVAFAMALEGE